MTSSLTLFCIWAVAANLAGMFPSRRNHWPAAYVLIVVGLPLLAYVAYENGPWYALFAFAAGASILRWPLYFLGRRIKQFTLKGR